LGHQTHCFNDAWENRWEWYACFFGFAAARRPFCLNMASRATAFGFASCLMASVARTGDGCTAGGWPNGGPCGRLGDRTAAGIGTAAGGKCGWYACGGVPVAGGGAKPPRAGGVADCLAARRAASDPFCACAAFCPSRALSDRPPPPAPGVTDGGRATAAT